MRKKSEKAPSEVEVENEKMNEEANKMRSNSVLTGYKSVVSKNSSTGKHQEHVKNFRQHI